MKRIKTIKGWLILYGSERFRIGYTLPHNWIKYNNSPKSNLIVRSLAWIISLERSPCYGGHYKNIQLSLVGLNVAYRYKIQD